METVAKPIRSDEALAVCRTLINNKDADGLRAAAKAMQTKGVDAGSVSIGEGEAVGNFFAGLGYFGIHNHKGPRPGSGIDVNSVRARLQDAGLLEGNQLNVGEIVRLAGPNAQQQIAAGGSVLSL